MPANRLFALVSVLEVCSDAEAEVFAAELLELLSKRHRAGAAHAVASVFRRLPPAARSAAVCIARDPLIQAALALDPRDPFARRSLAALAGATGAAPLAARLPDLLTDTDAGVADAAEQALVDLAAGVASGEADPESENTLLDAVGAFDRHRRKRILVAGLRLLGTPAALARATSSRAKWLTDPSHPAQLAIRALLRRQEEPGIAAAALVWLRVPAQASACRERVLATASPSEHEAVLRLAHLMTHPRRARALAAPGPRTGRELHLPAYADLSEEARRMTPRWIASLPLSAPESAAQLARLTGDSSPVVRLAVALHAGPTSEAELIDLAYDENADVARAAAVRLALRSGAATSPRPPSRETSLTLHRLARSPHAGVRALRHAGAEPGNDFGAPARNAWRLSLRRDRRAALAELRDRLLMGAPSERIPWISFARRLEVADSLERDLCDLADDFMPRDAESSDPDAAALAATAVASLGDCRGPRSRDVLMRALVGLDTRVAANAVEALARQAFRAGADRDELIARLVELKHADAHRVRATSALALLHVSDAARTTTEATAVLLDMLSDERPSHRLAGVWLAERAAACGSVEPSQLVAPVRELNDDADATVRTRAARCGRRLGILAEAPAQESAT